MLQLYSVFDKKTVSYSPPHHVKHVEEAIRAIKIELENPKSMLSRHASDYALYLIGHFDQDTGCVTPTAHGGPQFTIELLSLFSQIPPQGVQ